ncbi:MAG: hypothetical protein IJA36_00145 [Lachnospiraceae bacterium]|nr:hypothetical protein [Lachnospiraceae bacterium]
MEELYQLIEEKIKVTGCPCNISGRDFYRDISTEVEDKENGTYVFIVQKSDTLSYHGCMTVMEDEFDLHYVDIHVEEQAYHVDFDA